MKYYNLKLIPSWVFERGQEAKLLDPRGLGRETADRIVCFSKTKKDIAKAITVAKKEGKHRGLSKQNKTYYSSLVDELEDYHKKTESNLDMYRRCSK